MLSGILVILVLFLFNCRPSQSTDKAIDEELTLEGLAFGTSFHIKIYSTHQNISQSKLEQEISQVLQHIDLSMSSWRTDSEISRFNRHLSLQPFAISKAFYEILKQAQKIHVLTNKAFDPASAALFSLWGFNKQQNNTSSTSNLDPYVPKVAEIKKVLKQSGMHLLVFLPASIQIKKKHPQLKISLDAIAKGYAVDQVAAQIEQQGIESYMVEIGGEVKTGQRKPTSNKNASLWQLAIEKPSYTKKQTILTIAQLENMAMASSGNYRNYFKSPDKKNLYSHILDPRRGYPVDNTIAAVTIIGPECIIADALATALMVLSIEEGHKLIESLPNYEALWLLVTKRKGVYTQKHSSGMKSYLYLP